MDRFNNYFGSFWGQESAAQCVAAGATTAVATPTPAATPARPAAAAAPQDAANVQAEAESPYASMGAQAAQVKVDRWRGPNSTVEGILQRQGYSREEIYRRGADGKTLIQRVASVNDLKDPNLIHPGQNLTVPVKPQPQPEPAPAPAPAPQPRQEAPAPQPAPQQPAAQPQAEAAPPAPQPKPVPPAPRPAETTGVKVDRWGQGPDSSIDKILRNQGYTPEEIYRKDRHGRTLVDKVAQWNGLDKPEHLRAGSTLQVPVKPRPQPAPQLPAAQAPAPQPEAQQPQQPAAPPQPEAQQPQQPTAQPQPEAQQPQQPAAQPQPAAEGEEGLTMEMGLILDGAKEGRFTRNEFQALNSAANRYEELRATYSKDGYTPRELATLGQHERNYGAMYARFHQDDRTEIEFAASGDAQDPSTQTRVRMNEEGGGVFDRFSSGQLSMEDALEALRRQRLSARALGQAN